MRQQHTVQSSLFDYYVEHDIGQELKAMSHYLDAHPEILNLVAIDVLNPGVQETGRKGLTAESILRCALLKQHRQLSYQELSFCLLDSISCQAFARLPIGLLPKKSVLQESISRIREHTWEKINLMILDSAHQGKVEQGKMLRIDSTVTDALVHEPTDNSLLWDAVRVIVRLLKEAEELALTGTRIDWQNHIRRAKKRNRAIVYTRGQDKKAKLYQDLIQVTQNSLKYLEMAQLELSCSGVTDDLRHGAWEAQINHYKPLILQVIDQTQRRVFKGEKVPANEKLFSLFEEHTDIIVKGSRDIQYGHKLNLSSGRSGLILDVVIESGNPADSMRFIPMLDRHILHYGEAPKQTAADGGYASIDNLEQAKERGVKDVVFHKKRGLKVEDMAKSPWVYRKLRNFRAGIEAGISCLKRAFGLSRCTWRGLEHFKSYVWSCVVSHNLALLGRLLPT
jgi:IS5 family transposase